MNRAPATPTRSLPPTLGQVREELLVAMRADVQRLANTLLVLQWFAAIAFAAFVTPGAWNGHEQTPHPHVLAAIVLGGMASFVPILVSRQLPDSRYARLATAIGQVTFSVLLDVTSGGRVAFASHLLASLAVLAFYRDVVTVLVTGVAALFAEFLRVGHGGAIPLATSDAITIALSTAALSWGLTRTLRGLDALAAARVEVESTRASLDAREAESLERDVLARIAEVERAERETSLKSQSDFLASLSHELRTPLNAVVGFLELLGRTTLSPQQTGHVEGARTSAKHVLALISDVLEISKIESGALELERAPFDLRKTVHEAVRLVEGSARDKGISLEVDVSEDLAVPYVGDALRVRQILINLLGNAVKFTRSTIRVRGRWMGETDSILLEVEDDGQGIPGDRLARIFEPYRQADRSTAQRHGGTGLGLSISRKLARLMRGDLLVDSHLGTGSMFRLAVPLRRADPSEVASLRAEEAGTEVTVPPLRILFADDDASNRLVGRQVLQLLGHTVELATDGAQALSKAMNLQHDLVILDVEMPLLDGTEVARRLRTAGVNLPILGFTGHSSPQQRAACLRAGMDGVVEKPADIARLSRGIADVLLPRGGAKRTEYGREVAKSLASHVGVPTPPVGLVRPALIQELAERAANQSPAPAAPALRDVGSGLDLADLDKRVGGDQQLFHDVLFAVRDESRRLFGELSSAADREDLEAMRKVAHTLKGCLANVGARPVREAVTAVEVAAKSQDLQRTLELVASALPLGQSLSAALDHACEARAA